MTFSALHLIWVENWTSADAITFKELVLFLRSRNMVTLAMIYLWEYTSESINCPRVSMNRKLGKPCHSRANETVETVEN